MACHVINVFFFSLLVCNSIPLPLDNDDRGKKNPIAKVHFFPIRAVTICAISLKFKRVQSKMFKYKGTLKHFQIRNALIDVTY